MQAADARTTFRPRPFAGWALVSSCRLAAAFPSLLSHAVQCSPLKRQSLFACFAEIDWSRPDSMGDRLSHVAPADASAREPLLLIARSVVATRAAAVLEAVFGSVPDGLLGVMKRPGDQPFTHPGLYRLLHELMGNPIHRARAKVLTQISGLNATTIQIVRDLDQPWLRPEVVVRIRSREELSLLMDAVAVIRTVCPDVPQEYLAASFERLPARATIPEWADRWLKKATRFMAMPPIPDDPKFRLLESGAAMEAAGRELSNCLAEKTTACSVGRSGFLVYDDPPLAIIELARLENGGHTAWALDSICPPGNGRVLTSVAREIVENLTRAGILIPARFTEPAHIRRVTQFVGLVEFDFWDHVEDYARLRTTNEVTA